MSAMFTAGQTLTSTCRYQLLSKSSSSSVFSPTIRKYSCISAHISSTEASIFKKHKPTDNTELTNGRLCFVRNLYGPLSLGIDKLDRMKEVKMYQFASSRDRYVQRLKEYIERDETRSILRDDLINIISLADSEDDVDILEKIAKSKRVEQPQSIDSWGATAARLYYKLNLTDRLIDNIRDDSFGEFFRQITTYKIAMTMLYNEARYQEILDLYSHYSNKPLREIDPLSSLYYVACAKLNTPEALQLAKDKLTSSRDESFRNRTFVAYLAINQNEHAYALDVITGVKVSNYLTLNSLKMLSLMKIQRYEDLLIQLQRLVTRHEPGKTMILSDVCDMLLANSSTIQDGELRKEIESTLQDMGANKMVSEETLESMMFKESNYSRPQLPKKGSDYN